MREKIVEEALRLRVKAKGGRCIKFTAPGYTGVPDRLILMPGARVYFVELKAPDGKLSPRQEFVHKNDFLPLGHKVYVLSSLMEVTEFVNAL